MGDGDEANPPATEDPLGVYPSEGKELLKLKADELDYIVIVPRNYEGKFPLAEQADFEKFMSVAKAKISELEVEKTDLAGKIAELEKQVKEITEAKESAEETVAKHSEEQKKTLVGTIVEQRLEKGLTKEDNKDEVAETLMKLSEPELEILKTDLENFKTPSGDPDPITQGAGADLSEDKEEEAKLREEMFGHKEPIEEYLEKTEGVY